MVQEGSAVRELGPDEPLPPAAADAFMEVLLPLLREVLSRFQLSVDDFDDGAWASFVSAAFGHAFGRAADTRRLHVVLEGVLEEKLERLRRMQKES